MLVMLVMLVPKPNRVVAMCRRRCASSHAVCRETTRLVTRVDTRMRDIEMADPKELQEKFWKALKSDRTVMLGLDGVEDGHARPMTAQIEGDSGGPIWFFTSKDNALIAMLGRAVASSAPSAARGMICSPASVAPCTRTLTLR